MIAYMNKKCYNLFMSKDESIFGSEGPQDLIHKNK